MKFEVFELLWGVATHFHKWCFKGNSYCRVIRKNMSPENVSRKFMETCSLLYPLRTFVNSKNMKFFELLGVLSYTNYRSIFRPRFIMNFYFENHVSRKKIAEPF